MRTTLIGRWLEKNNKPFVALLVAGATLAMATLIDASSSSQVEQLGLLAVPRTGHAATALADGRVLITGGRDSAGTIVAIAEVFDPESQTSTAIGILNTPRIDHTATLLADGRVLIAGGNSASGALTSAEIFDPANPGAGFRVLSATMGAARAGHTATRLHDGTVLIAGGDDAGTAEIFKPTTESFSSTLLAMAAPRIGHTATLFSDDSVLLAGGNTDSMEYFSSVDQTFTLDPQKMTAARTGHEAIGLSDTRLLFFGGDTDHTIDEFNSSADTLMLKATMDGAFSSATLLANGKILVLRPDAAGLYAPDATDQATAFTLFDEASVPGSTALLRQGQTATELSGDKKILVAGGQNAQNQPVLQIAAFNPARIWTDKDDYQPDDPVILSGSGWKTNENIYLFAVDSETDQWTYESTIPANGNGEFSVDPYFIVQLRQLGTHFHVTAMGAQSALQADVHFTDSKPNTVTVGPPNSVSVTPGGIANYAVHVNFNGNGSSCTSPLSISAGLPAGILPADVVFTPDASPGSTGGTVGTVDRALAITTHAGTTPGSYTFTVLAANGGGTCQSGTATGTGVLVVTQHPTITSADNTSFTVGTAGTFNVTATGFPTPTISFTASLPSGVTLSSAGLLSGTPASGTFGDYTITITAQNGISPNDTQILTLHVNKVAAAFANLTGSQSIVYGQSSIGLSGRLNPGYPSTPGPISITINGASQSVNLSGNANNFAGAPISFNTSTIPASAVPYPISYFFGGDVNNLATTDTSTTLTVNRANTSTAITSDLPDPSTTVQSVTVNYHVSVTAPGSGTPTGNVHVTDGVDSCDGTAAAGTCNLTLTTVGSRTLTATYAGDSNFNGSASPGAPHTANPGTVNTTTTVTSSLNPSTYGQTVTFTAKLTVASGTSNPTGTVQFVIDGSNAGAPATLGACSPAVAGTACASTSTSTLSHTGSPHTVSATYTPESASFFNTSSGSLTDGQAVNALALTVTGITANNKEYDGNDTAALSLGGAVLHMPVSGDDVSLDTLSSYAAHFNDKTLANDKPVTVTGLALTGAAAGNYTLTQPTGLMANITSKALTVTGITVNTRDYNGTDSATLNLGSAVLHDPVPLDNVSLDTLSSYSPQFNNRNAGMNKPVTVTGLTLSGADAGNYTLTQPTGLTGTINPLVIDVTAVTDTKTYDGDTTSAGTPSISPALFSPDTSNFVQTFDSRNAENRTLTPSGSVDDGNSGNNYTPHFHTAAGTINQRSITVTAQTNTKTFDGNTSAVAVPQITTGSLAPVGGDTPNFSETYDNANAGMGKTLTPSGSVSDGNSGLNYDVHFVNNMTGVINAAHTSTAVTSSLNPSVYGQSVSFTATVSNTDTSPVPTGSVQFKIDGVNFGGPVALSGTGSATSGATTTIPVPGSPHAVTAIYTNTDGNFVNGSGSLAGGQTVTKAMTTTTITSDNPDPSIIGQPYDVHWTVIPQYSGTPTGNVSVSDGTNNCSSAVSAGFCTLTSTTVGAKTLTANYPGDDNFKPSSDTEDHGVQYIFVGFLPPVDNFPIPNSTKAGQTIPIKWQLKDYNGNLISSLGTLVSLTSGPTACDATPADVIEELATPGQTMFRFDGTQFIYNWQTLKSYNGCRLVQLKLSDGTSYYAKFTFK